jgi:hypothetical protein
MFECLLCEQLFESLDGLILVDGSNTNTGSSLYFTADKKGIHEIKKCRADGEPEVLTITSDLADE